MKKQTCQVTWTDVEQTIKINLDKFKDYDRIVGVSRGGVILASLIQRFFPEAQLEVYDAEFPLTVSDDRVLVVDDIWDTGTTIESINSRAFVREGILNFFTLVSKSEEVPSNVSYGQYLQTPEWVHFPWEIEENV